MSKIISIELQNLVCPAVPAGTYDPEAEERNPGMFGQEPGLHLVAVLCQGVDGHRCYVAAYKMPDLSRVGEMNAETEELWEREKQKAAIFAHRHGNKVPPEGVRMFFAMDPESVEWGTMKKKPMTKAAKWEFAQSVAQRMRESFDSGSVENVRALLTHIEELYEWPEPDGCQNPEEQVIHDRMNTINILCDQAHSAAKAAGWWHPPNPKNRNLIFGPEIIPEKMMMIVTELGEAVREYSKHGHAAPAHLDFQYELADVAIRLFDIAGRFQIPLGDRIIGKMAKNKHRGHRHGGKHA